MAKQYLGSQEPREMYIGSTPVKKVYFGSTLLWQKSTGGGSTGGDTGGGETGDTTHTLVITSYSANDVPAEGGSVSSCTVYYTLDGVSKSATKTFASVTGTDLGSTIKMRTLLETRNVTITESGESKAIMVYIYQSENNVVSTTITSRGEWAVGGGGAVSVNGGAYSVTATQTCTAVKRYTSGTEVTDTNYQDNISVTWATDGTVCTGVSGNKGSYRATIAKNENPSTRSGWARATYDGSNKTVAFSQPAAEKKAIDYLNVTATQVPNSPTGVMSVTVENASNRKINFKYKMGSSASNEQEYTASVEGGDTWGNGGYWKGITSASFA